ncbi:MAG TPA: hypothetical protein VK957_18150 [Lunatimonas sp.]|nr:hypothetical protein [Lunatimonas sp.]
MKKHKDSLNIDSLVKVINENPDRLHLDYTPAVHQLIEYGVEAIEAVLPSLNSQDKWERLRALRVLEGVINRQNGWKSGIGFPDGSDGEQKTRELLQQNGNYQYDAPIEQRTSSIAKWKEWLKGQNTKNVKK